MRVGSVVLALVVSLVFIGNLSAADQKAPPTKAEHQADGPWGMLKGLNLTDAQKAKVKELGKEYEPKFKAAADKVLTADQKKARDAAVKAAKDSGKKGPEAFKAVMAVVRLTDAQKAKMKEAMQPLVTEFREKMKAILTPAQQDQLKGKIAVPENRGHGPWDMFKGLNLTDAQKAKVEGVRKEYEPKFKAAVDSVLTTDQKKARDAAVKAAKDSGKKGPEVFNATRATVKLTDAQKAKMKEAMQPLVTEFREKMKAILTPVQQEQLKAQIAKHAPGARGRPQGGSSPQCHSSQSKDGPCAFGHGASNWDGKWQGHHKCGHCGHHKHHHKHAHHKWGHHGHHGHHHGCHHGHHGHHGHHHCHHGHHHGCHRGHHHHHGHHHGCHHGHHGHHHCHHGHHHGHHGHHNEMMKGQHGSCPSKCPSAATCPVAKKPTAKCPLAATCSAAKVLTGTKAIEANLAALEREKTATVAALKKAEEVTKARLIALDKQRKEALANLAKAKKAEKESIVNKKN